MLSATPIGLRALVAVLCLFIAVLVPTAYGKSNPGKTEVSFNHNVKRVNEPHPLLANTQIFVKIHCSSEEKVDLVIYWTLTERQCWFENSLMQSVYVDYENQLVQQNQSKESVVVSPKYHTECLHMYALPEVTEPIIARTFNALRQAEQLDVAPNGAEAGDSGGGGGGGGSTAAAAATPKAVNPNPKKLQNPSSPTKPMYTVTQDGIYDLALFIAPTKKDIQYSARVYIDYLGPHGYISAIDWPLLPFYGIMCVVYVIFGIIWLVVSFLQWRDLLRIQFWIGGVILLGMLEKAFFYAKYHSLNTTGFEVPGAELAAEFVSCAKRTLARMLVIIMSLGFGIVKPRLGPMLHRVVGVGALYFLLAFIESYLRVSKVQDIRSRQQKQLVASIPLAVLETGICWWIFTSLVQTTRTLRLRRNMVKLSLYRHFTNTLIFAVIASVIYMLYAMRLHKIQNCSPYWHDIWVDNAFWHVLFSSLLLVIMILWRPTNNNQRYAFTPLLDNPEDEDDDEEEDQFVADAYGVKMRSTHTNGGKTPSSSQRATTTEEDDLRWVEENIPSSMSEPALPVLDSDEEIINTKFEVSKMQ